MPAFPISIQVKSVTLNEVLSNYDLYKSNLITFIKKYVFTLTLTKKFDWLRVVNI